MMKETDRIITAKCVKYPLKFQFCYLKVGTEISAHSPILLHCSNQPKVHLFYTLLPLICPSKIQFSRQGPHSQNNTLHYRTNISKSCLYISRTQPKHNIKIHKLPTNVSSIITLSNGVFLSENNFLL